MKMYTLVLIVFLLIIIVPDLFFYRHLKDRKAKPIFFFLHLIPTVFFTILFLYIKFGLEHAHNFRIVVWIMWLYFFFFIIYIPKVVHIIFYALQKLYVKRKGKENSYYPVVRVLISLSIIMTMLAGAYITPRRFELTKTEIAIAGLPREFDGLRIIQISDLHLGSWNNKYSKLVPIINIVNAQNADILVFTGDMVNNYAEEADGWQPYFLQLRAKSAKFAILGNHDYGDYTEWRTSAERNNNKLEIQKAIRGFGFRLLNNDHIVLKKDTSILDIIGVENWGKSEKWRYSNLKKALSGCKPEEIKILLAHDPNEWDAEVKDKTNIVLTLSGHTHAAQLGLKVGHKLFSPAAFVFKHYAGLYSENNQYLYVNRGIGYIGLPMQIGVRPEISLIVLKSKP